MGYYAVSIDEWLRFHWPHCLHLLGHPVDYLSLTMRALQSFTKTTWPNVPEDCISSSAAVRTSNPAPLVTLQPFSQPDYNESKPVAIAFLVASGHRKASSFFVAVGYQPPYSRSWKYCSILTSKFTEYFPGPNVTGEWIRLLIRIRNVAISNITWNTGHYAW